MMSEISSSHPHVPCDQCFPVRAVGRTTYPPAIKLTDRRKKAFLADFSRHGILVRAARAASPRAWPSIVRCRSSKMNASGTRSSRGTGTRPVVDKFANSELSLVFGELPTYINFSVWVMEMH